MLTEREAAGTRDKGCSMPSRERHYRLPASKANLGQAYGLMTSDTLKLSQIVSHLLVCFCDAVTHVLSLK